jgi:DNA-binding NarL/FixJ family response regulator
MNPQRALRILVVDDHDVVQWGLRILLTREQWVERCVGARSGEEAIRLATRYEPHVALVDLLLGHESGAELCEQLRAAAPSVRIALMSGVGHISAAVARGAGAAGFVSKAWNGQDLAHAVRMIGLGVTVFPPESEQPFGLLSDREREVLNLLATGATNREIASELYLSPHTIKDHTTALYKKMKARNRAEAVVRAQRLGFLA